MQGLLEWSREGLRDGYLFDTGILSETSLLLFPLQTSPGPTLHKVEGHPNCLHSSLTVSHLSEHDHLPRAGGTERL